MASGRRTGRAVLAGDQLPGAAKQVGAQDGALDEREVDVGDGGARKPDPDRPARGAEVLRLQGAHPPHHLGRGPQVVAREELRREPEGEQRLVAAGRTGSPHAGGSIR